MTADLLEVEGTLILGAGLAGLFAALKMAPRPVTLLSPTPMGSGGSSAWAQAGIAAAIGAGDSPGTHAADTIAVGAGLVDRPLAAGVAEEAAARLQDLAGYGVRFDRDKDGNLLLAREAGHSAARIAGTGFDGAGREIMRALVGAARRTGSIRVIEGASAVGLTLADGHVTGARTRFRDGSIRQLSAPETVLAAGGPCGLYRVCTSPPGQRGQAMAMAAAAGAMIADAEFVQFHPTGIDLGQDPTPLASESLRGAGAVLVDDRGDRFLPSEHPDAELAPRDVVARAIFRQRKQGRKTYLDARSVFAARRDAFPNVAETCRLAGFDPAEAPIPVAPSAHFHIGGVRTDERGRTSLDRLFACGEIAATGLHGGNRLGSNSLLEACVFAGRIADDLADAPATPPRRRCQLPDLASEAGPGEDRLAAARIGKLRDLMDLHVGVERDGDGLAEALRGIARLRRGGISPHFAALSDAATLIAAAALLRRESRGAHFRRDFPAADADAATRSEMKLETATRLRRELSE